MKVFIKKYILIIGVVGLVGFGLFAFGKDHKINISGLGSATISKNPSSIAGLNCADTQRRPVAVMMPSDPETRPLAGISQADVVVEMPVTPNGVTRFMAVFQCQTPKEIGSIRSAREDFIPLAASFNAIYAHWGGEHGALDRLNKHVMDNINALLYDGNTFYRKKSIPKPHNGFTTLALLFSRAKNLGYSQTKDFAGYPHSDAKPTRNLSNIATSVSVPYPSPYNVTWTYNQAQNVYSRTRGNKAELDKNTNKQVTARVITVMHTTSQILVKGDQYIEVKTTGEGMAEVYQNGVKITGTWKKDSAKLDSKLFFYDQNGDEIKFAPGQIWIEIVSSS